MASNSDGGSVGWPGLPIVLFLIFLVLKLCDVIAWSWWWVTAPLWIPLAVFAAFFFFCLAMALFVAWQEWKHHRK